MLYDTLLSTDGILIFNCLSNIMEHNKKSVVLKVQTDYLYVFVFRNKTNLVVAYDEKKNPITYDIMATEIRF